MTYSISQVRASDATGQVISAEWSFATDKGSLSSEHVLHQPAGSVPADQITEAVLLDWLKQQLPESETEMTESIAAEHERRVASSAVISMPLKPGETLAAATEQRRQEIAAEQEQARLYRQQMEALRQQIAAALPWDAATTYKLGDVVTHNGKAYRKSDESDNTEPDDVPGGWEEV